MNNPVEFFLVIDGRIIKVQGEEVFPAPQDGQAVKIQAGWIIPPKEED